MREMEIDPRLLGKRRIDSIVHRSKQYELRPEGCEDTRCSNSGRPATKDLSDPEKIKRLGNCWDNAPQESFFGHMKDEIHLERCKSFKELTDEIDDYMDYYNNDRYQWGLAKLSPNQYAQYLQSAIYPVNT